MCCDDFLPVKLSFYLVAKFLFFYILKYFYRISITKKTVFIVNIYIFLRLLRPFRYISNPLPFFFVLHSCLLSVPVFIIFSSDIYRTSFLIPYSQRKLVLPSGLLVLWFSRNTLFIIEFCFLYTWPTRFYLFHLISSTILGLLIISNCS